MIGKLKKLVKKIRLRIIEKLIEESKYISNEEKIELMQKYGKTVRLI